jgi:hypothetical protein
MDQREIKHTPGPWRIQNNANTGITSISGKNWDQFAQVVTRLSDDEFDFQEGVANAKLIKAAPDLLKALVVCVDLLNKDSYHQETEEAVIRLANDAIFLATYNHTTFNP